MFCKIIFLIGFATLVFTDEECGPGKPLPCATCTTSWGFETCKCPEGYEKFLKTCEDKDECEWISTHNCDQKCENTIGSYKCSCKPGYVLQDDKQTCKKTTENESGESDTEQKSLEKSIETTSNATEASVETSATDSSATTDTAATTSTTTSSSAEATGRPNSDKSDETSEEADESKKVPIVAPANLEKDDKNRYELSNTDNSDFLENAVLYYSVDDEIKAYSLAQKNVRTIIGSLNRARSLTINGNDLYWSDTYPDKQQIVHSTISGAEARLHVLPDEYSGLMSAEEVEVDWITGNLYYVDQRLRHIGVCSPRGTQCTALVKRNIIKPRSIALNPQRGEMYWSDWEAPAKISHANMDGTQETPFVSTNIAHPQGLTIDYAEQTLYWTDYSTHSLNRIMLNGSGRKVLLELFERFQPFSLAVHKNLLYWSDISGRSVMSCDKNTGGNLQSVIEEKEKVIYGISIYDPDQALYRSIKNPCSSPRLCDDMCLLKGQQGHSCACFHNRWLKNDFKSCENRNTMINPGRIMRCNEAIHFRCRTGKCISKNQECNGFADCLDSSDEHDRCTTTQGTTKSLPSLITSNLPCTVNNMPHNYLIVKNSVYDVDRNTQVILEAQNVKYVDVYPAKYAHAYIDVNGKLILNFKQINEKEEPSKSAEMYYYSFTLRLNCYNGGYVNMFTKVPVIDTNTYDPVFEKPSYTIKLISTAASDFEVVHKLNRIIATDHDVTNGKLEFSMSKNEYFDVAYDGIVPNSLGKKHYAKLIPKASEFKRSVHVDIFVADSGNPVRTGWTKLNILLPSSPVVPIFTKSFYTGDYDFNTATFQMNEYPKLQERANFGSMGFVLEPSTYFTLFPNQDEIIIKCLQRIPYDVAIGSNYMILELRAGDISSFSDSNSKTVIIINLHR